MGSELKIDILNPSEATKDAVNYLKTPGDVLNLGVPATVQGLDDFSKNSPTNTYFLLQGSLADTSAITGVRAVTNSGVTVDLNGDFVFDGSSYLYNPIGTLSSIFTPTSEWTIDFDFIINSTSHSIQAILGEGGTGDNRFDVNWSTAGGGTVSIGAFGGASTGWTDGIWHRLTIEYWNDGGTRKVSIYRNGSVVNTTIYTLTGTLNDTDVWSWGWDGETGGREFIGNANHIRVSNTALHNGSSFSTTAGVDYPDVDEEWSTALVEQSTPSLTNKIFGRNASNEPIEISHANINKSILNALGNITGAVSVDYDNGDYQTATTTGAVTGITISNLPQYSGMILAIDNSAGLSVTFGSTEIISSSETGIYACAFFNKGGTIKFQGKGEEQS